MLNNAEVDKYIIYALAGIIIVLTIAVILLAIKKNIYYVVEAQPEHKSVSQKQQTVHRQAEPETLPAYENPAPSKDSDLVTSTLQVPLHVKSAAVRKCLITITIAGRTAEREITSFPCLLGRESDCDVVIGESAVSRRHCRFILEQGQLYLEDVSEHNGTYINGQKLPSLVKGRLHEGDRISIGRAAIVVQQIGY